MTLTHVLTTHPTVPIQVERASGSVLYDNRGRGYIDWEAGLWCMALGYGHPAIQAATTAQSAKVAHLGPLLTGPVVEQAATALLATTPHPDGKALFLSSGSEAVETAMRIARHLTGRSRFLTLQRSYLGAYGFSGRDLAESRVEIDITPCLNCRRSDCYTACPALSAVDPQEVAAFVWEPVMASGGVIEPPHRLIRLLVQWVQAAGGLAVVDEVTTGLGRTGALWGFEHAGAVPDLIATGKGLGNGYPVSAVIASAWVARAVEGSTFRVAQSHQNDPLAAAIAAQVLNSLQAEGLVEQARERGELLGTHLRAIQRNHDLVVDVRGRGLLWGLELAPVTVAGRPVAEVVFERMLAAGHHLGVKAPLNLLRLLPPLVITPEQIELLSRALDRTLSEL